MARRLGFYALAVAGPSFVEIFALCIVVVSILAFWLLQFMLLKGWKRKVFARKEHAHGAIKEGRRGVTQLEWEESCSCAIDIASKHQLNTSIVETRKHRYGSSVWATKPETITFLSPWTATTRPRIDFDLAWALSPLVNVAGLLSVTHRIGHADVTEEEETITNSGGSNYGIYTLRLPLRILDVLGPSYAALLPRRLHFLEQRQYHAAARLLHNNVGTLLCISRFDDHGGLYCGTCIEIPLPMIERVRGVHSLSLLDSLVEQCYHERLQSLLVVGQQEKELFIVLIQHSGGHWNLNLLYANSKEENLVYCGARLLLNNNESSLCFSRDLHSGTCFDLQSSALLALPYGVHRHSVSDVLDAPVEHDDRQSLRSLEEDRLFSDFIAFIHGSGGRWKGCNLHLLFASFKENCGRLVGERGNFMNQHAWHLQNRMTTYYKQASTLASIQELSNGDAPMINLATRNQYLAFNLDDNFVRVRDHQALPMWTMGAYGLVDEPSQLLIQTNCCQVGWCFSHVSGDVEFVIGIKIQALIPSLMNGDDGGSLDTRNTIYTLEVLAQRSYPQHELLQEEGQLLSDLTGGRCSRPCDSKLSYSYCDFRQRLGFFHLMDNFFKAQCLYTIVLCSVQATRPPQLSKHACSQILLKRTKETKRLDNVFELLIASFIWGPHMTCFGRGQLVLLQPQEYNSAYGGELQPVLNLPEELAPLSHRKEAECVEDAYAFIVLEIIANFVWVSVVDPRQFLRRCKQQELSMILHYSPLELKLYGMVDKLQGVLSRPSLAEGALVAAYTDLSHSLPKETAGEKCFRMTILCTRHQSLVMDNVVKGLLKNRDQPRSYSRAEIMFDELVLDAGVRHNGSINEAFSHSMPLLDTVAESDEGDMADYEQDRFEREIFHIVPERGEHVEATGLELGQSDAAAGHQLQSFGNCSDITPIPVDYSLENLELPEASNKLEEAADECWDKFPEIGEVPLHEEWSDIPLETPTIRTTQESSGTLPELSNEALCFLTSHAVAGSLDAAAAAAVASLSFFGGIWTPFSGNEKKKKMSKEKVC